MTDTETQSFWKLIADSLDDLIGVKNKPHRLLVIINVLFVGLFLSGLWIQGALNALIASSPPPITDTKPSILSLRPWELSQAGIRRNSYILHQNIHVVTYLLYAFFATTAGLIIFTNIVGVALVRDAFTKKKNA